MSQISTDDVPADEVEAHRMPLMDHLRELRKRMMISAGAVGVAMLISLAFTDQILAFITAPVEIALPDAKIDGGLSIVSRPGAGAHALLSEGAA